MESKQKSIFAKIIFIVLLVLVASTAVVGVIGYVLNRSDAVNLNAEKAMAISNSVAYTVDPAEFEQIMESGQKDDFWYTFKEYVDNVAVENDLKYLYILGSDYDTHITYFAEGFNPATGDEELDLGYEESIDAYAPEFYNTLATGQPSSTDMYKLENFGNLVSGFSAIKDDNGQVIGGVGVDLSVDEVLVSANQFGLIIIVIIAGLCIALGFFLRWYIRKNVSNPIEALTGAAEQIAMGNTDVSILANENNEIGRLAESFRHMTASTKHQADVLEQLADGNLTVDIQPRSDKDTMSRSIKKMIANLSNMFGKINGGAKQVSAGAKQIADSAQTLAQGATEQAGTVEELSRSIASVAEQTKESAQKAEQAAKLADTIKSNAQKGSGQMEQMIHAVQEIDDASASIQKVIKAIDEIAFQTNILALNAAVEAARAGEHGKGFAVVAEEVRNLAQKSSESAKDTGALIENSLQKTQLGVQIAGQTSASLAEIVEGINESSRIVKEIAESSEKQSNDILQINQGVDQVAQVVQQNSATSQESAAASQEMSSQAGMLEQLIARFKIE